LLNLHGRGEEWLSVSLRVLGKMTSENSLWLLILLHAIIPKGQHLRHVSKPKVRFKRFNDQHINNK